MRDKMVRALPPLLTVGRVPRTEHLPVRRDEDFRAGDRRLGGGILRVHTRLSHGVPRVREGGRDRKAADIPHLGRAGAKAA